MERFARAESGGVSMITGLSAVALIGFVGFATDAGALYLESRRLQGAVDLAALEAAGSASLDPSALTLPSFDSAQVVVERGRYIADRQVPVDRRFTVASREVNAVRVSARVQSPLYFSRMFYEDGAISISRQATAAQARLAAFEIGSRLLSLNGGIANQTLSALTGSSVNLSVMDYNALLNADVDLLNYVEALATRLDLEAASFDETLNTEMDTADALEGIADVIAATDRTAARALRQIASTTNGRVENLDSLIDLGPYGASDTALAPGSARVEVSAMDLATAILQIAGGERQVKLELGAGVAGLAETNVWLAIGERPNNSPWIAITQDDEVVVRTAQMRLYVVADVRAAAPLATVRVPILLEAASAQARLSDVRCGANAGARGVTLAVAPSVGALTLGDINVNALDNFKRDLRPGPAALVRIGSLARVDGVARVQVGGEQWQDVHFNADDIAHRRRKTVVTRDAARATASSLLGQTDLTVRAGGLSLGTGVLTNATRGALTTAAAPLDALLNGLEDLLGLHVGEADVRVNGVRCGGAVLVG